MAHLDTWIVVCAETVGDDRIAVVAVRATHEDDALYQAAAYFEDWHFIQPGVTATKIPEFFIQPIPVFSFAR